MHVADYYARVELHGVGAAAYEQLHATMEITGFLRVIVVDGKKYKLPTGSYWKTGDPKALDLVAAMVHVAAAAVDPAASVVVVEAAQVSTSALDEA